MTNSYNNKGLIMDNKRLEYVDIAKGVMILLVIVGHIVDNYIGGEVHDKIFTFIYSFHMCVFFLLSGFVMGVTQQKLQAQSFTKLLWNKCQTLFIPFVIWSLFVFRYIDPIITTPLNLLAIKNLFIHSDYGVWFFLSLFVIQIVCYPIFRFKSRWAWTIPIGIVLTGSIVLSYYGNESLIFIYCDPYHYLGFIMGYIFYRHQEWVFRSDTATIALLFFIITEIVHPNPFLATLSGGMVLLYSCKQISGFINKSDISSPWLYRTIQVVGKNTMAIYPIHFFFIRPLYAPLVLNCSSISLTLTMTVLIIVSFFIALISVYISNFISYFPIIDKILLGKKRKEYRYN